MEETARQAGQQALLYFVVLQNDSLINGVEGGDFLFT